MKYAPAEKLKLQAIKTKDHTYISDNEENSSYFTSKIPHLLIDGEKAVETYNKHWFKVKAIPEKIERTVSGERVNMRYELRPEHSSLNLPQQVACEDVQDGGKYESVYGLYEYKYDMTEPRVEEVAFDLHVVEELDHFEITKSQFTPKYSLLDRITTHPILLSTKPQKLSKGESYQIIRRHIQENIDGRYAKITSDYDFCLTVSKIISHEPIKYLVDVGKRKTKYQERYRSQRTVDIYKATPTKYQGYPDVIEFEGLNEEDLKNNIKEYLDDLMSLINEPLKECDCCNGRGVVDVKGVK